LLAWTGGGYVIGLPWIATSYILDWWWVCHRVVMGCAPVLLKRAALETHALQKCLRCRWWPGWIWMMNNSKNSNNQAENKKKRKDRRRKKRENDEEGQEEEEEEGEGVLSTYSAGREADDMRLLISEIS
jgi:hypothetical protein